MLRFVSRSVRTNNIPSTATGTPQEPQANLKKSLLAQVVAQELGETLTSSSNSTTTSENSKPLLFSWNFGKKKTIETNEKNGSSTSKVDSASGGFIFGSRLSEKVTNADPLTADEKPKDASSIFKQFSTTPVGESFFSFKPPSADSTTLKPFGDSSTIKPSFTTATASDSVEQVETLTGEEGEKNLLHISCKFYLFDREKKTWLERGMGTLRINEQLDVKHEYRIVGRATGNQRVCINSKIFPEMLLEKMSDKRMKFSAVSPDSDVPQLFVVNATPAAIASLQEKMEKLVARVKANANRKRPLTDVSENDNYNVPVKTPSKELGERKEQVDDKKDDDPTQEGESTEV